jgi:hypothetical protein
MSLNSLSTSEMLRHSGHWLADVALCAELDGHPVGAVLLAGVREVHEGLAEQVAEQREREGVLARRASRLARRERDQESLTGALRRTLQGLQATDAGPGAAALYRGLASRLPAPVMAYEREFEITRDAHTVSAIESAHTRLARLRWVNAVETFLSTLGLVEPLAAIGERVQRSLQASIAQRPGQPAGQRQAFENVRPLG